MSEREAIGRRKFLGAGAGAVAGAACAPLAAGEIAAAGTRETAAAGAGEARDWAAIHGFNYQPSYGSSGFELWQKFDAAIIDRELGRGKKHFPGMNAIRLWLSWDSYLRDPRRFAGNFSTSLDLAGRRGLLVLPVLFNRWHSAELDYGGIYVDHFLPAVSWVQSPGMFDRYLDDVVGGHKGDPRILAWDLCNEPYSYSCPREAIPAIAAAETAWLRSIGERCRKLGADAPITVGIHPGVPLEVVEPISDLLSIHPYFMQNAPGADRAAFEAALDRDVAIAAKSKKPILATECCWGSLDDAVRAESVRYTLAQLKKRRIGWLAYLLHHSLVADAHRPEFGPLGFPGNLAFIEADGSLRAGHGAFNEF